jgi:ATP-dependent RNA helicase DHX29
VGQGDRDLSEISHIIVDEVHERTVLGDFLLVILKDLLERRRANGSPPLKLILMSATLDSNLFSSYFGNCPVISAKGRTFPVTTFFLENIYEQLDYRLASDSPAAFFNSSKGHSRKLARNVVDSNRGRQDLVNSGWGDETKLEQELRNPLFDIDLYHSFSEKTRINLVGVVPGKVVKRAWKDVFFPQLFS